MAAIAPERRSYKSYGLGRDRAEAALLQRPAAAIRL